MVLAPQQNWNNWQWALSERTFFLLEWMVKPLTACMRSVYEIPSDFPDGKQTASGCIISFAAKSWLDCAHARLSRKDDEVPRALSLIDKTPGGSGTAFQKILKISPNSLSGGRFPARRRLNSTRLRPPAFFTPQAMLSAGQIPALRYPQPWNIVSRTSSFRIPPK